MLNIWLADKLMEFSPESEPKLKILKNPIINQQNMYSSDNTHLTAKRWPMNS